MKLQNILTTAIASAILSTSAFAAPSAKFAAVYSTDVKLDSVVFINDADASDGSVTVDIMKTGYKLATIKSPQGKELLVGLSAQIGLVTDTSIKGKLGADAKAMANAKALVTIYAVPTGEWTGPGSAIKALPGDIILSQRIQELSATLGGVIESCTDGDIDGDGIANVDPDGTIDVATECIVTDEEIGLMQSTTAAHHYNFVLPDLVADEYDIVALFTTGAIANVEICDSTVNIDTNDDKVADASECDLEDGLVSASAAATAIIANTMMTIQEVRAVKDSIKDVIILEDSCSGTECL